MITFILTIHVILAICIILVVLMQKSEGGGLGIGGSGTGGGFMTARGTANFMTKLTAFLGGCFFLTSIILALLSSQETPSISNEVKKTIEDTSKKAPAVPLGN
jgi:preprotein translocase subunit SecG